MNPTELTSETGSEICDIAVHELDDTKQLFPHGSSLLFTELLASMRERGQLTPIKVMSADGPFTIIDGYRRTRAARCLGWSTLRVQVYGPMTLSAALRLAQESNPGTRIKIKPGERSDSAAW